MRSRSVQIIAATALVFVVYSTPAKASPEPRSSGKEQTRPAIPPQIEAMLDNAEDFPSNGTWLVPPRPMVGDYPEYALAHLISGSATVACIAPADGIIRFCKVVEEIPAGSGFGESAINIVARGKLNPSEDLQTINTFKVRIPFNVN